MRQPPMLDIALGELTAGDPDKMLARQGRPDRGERHSVLELIAKSVGAARLVEARTRPEPAGDRLIEQPAVEHDVDRTVGRLDLDGTEQSFPLLADLGQRRVRIRIAI